MSATASIAILQPSAFEAGTHHACLCPRCGTQVSHPQMQALREAQARIEELESQVRVLTLRATSAVEKATEYETSLRRLNSTRQPVPPNIEIGRSSLDAQASRAQPSPLPSAFVTTPYSSTYQTSPPRPAVANTTSRLARLLPTRASSTASAPPSSNPQIIQSTPKTPHTSYPPYPLTGGFDSSHLPLDLNNLGLPPSALASPSPSELSLISALTHEQTLRKAAESAAEKTNSEIEELTGQLFEQANEMVATERKARARLEHRVEVLEQREGEKSKRLGLLETRVMRVERVRGLLERERSLSLSAGEGEGEGEAGQRGRGPNG